MTKRQAIPVPKPFEALGFSLDLPVAGTILEEGSTGSMIATASGRGKNQFHLPKIENRFMINTVLIRIRGMLYDQSCSFSAASNTLQTVMLRPTQPDHGPSWYEARAEIGKATQGAFTPAKRARR
ncbi:hypothetical protein [Pacificoceanicola onchidii]|uniref:hypothetical protein n=1 Tax=Pacificoceanicola onchidii TaxID=2562685 RepID=UPI0014560D47|nr:hypothetical protein [Pacificoceanicola onchidii]